MIDCAAALHEQGLLLSKAQLLDPTSPITTINEFKALPKQYRKNIVNKRLQAMGIPYGQPIPKQGNEVRYYTALGDLHTGDIVNINHHDRTCTVSTSINLRTITHTSTTARRETER